MLISLFKYNQPYTEVPAPIYKMGDPSVKLPLIYWFFLIPHVHIISSGLINCMY